jgi:Uma2 family endonuclease
MEALRRDESYNYADYRTWDDDTRWELIDGVAYAMSAPSTVHQRVLSRFHGQLFQLLSGNPCEVFPAPFDVRLNADEEDDTVVQPDLSVICDKTKIDDKGCRGAPDLIIEIVSPSTSGYDKVLKYNKYRNAGVKEYWIADPSDKTVLVSNFKQASVYYGESDKIPLRLLPEGFIDLAGVFAE